MILLFLFLKSNYKMRIFLYFHEQYIETVSYCSFLTTEAQKKRAGKPARLTVTF